MYKFCEKKIPKILLFRPPFLIYKKKVKKKRIRIIAIDFKQEKHKKEYKQNGVQNDNI